MPAPARCPRCEYDCASLLHRDAGVRAPITCPECGHTMQQGVLLRPTRRTFPDWTKFIVLALATLFVLLLVITLIPSVYTRFVR